MPKMPSANLPELAERLIEVRKRSGLNQREFADRLAISWRALQSYEQAKSVPGGSVLRDYANQGVDLNWLVTGRALESENGRVDINDSALASIPNAASLLAEFVPAYMGCEVKSDVPLLVLNPSILEEFKAGRRGAGHAIPSFLTVVRINDDSMEPTLARDTLAIVDRSIDRPEMEGLYAFQREGSIVVRRVQQLGPRRLLLRCDNPEWDAEVLQEGIAQHKIVGAVLFGLKSLK